MVWGSLHATEQQNETLEGDGSDDHEANENPEVCCGNQSRGLWKATCVRLQAAFKRTFNGFLA